MMDTDLMQFRFEMATQPSSYWHSIANAPRHGRGLDLITMLDLHNPLVQSFRIAKDRFRESLIQPVTLCLIGTRQHNARQYNLPTASEVAALIPGDGNPTDSRDVIVEERGNEHRRNPVKRISELHPSFMALQYPLLFPYGEDGFHLQIPLNVPPTTRRKYISSTDDIDHVISIELPFKVDDPIGFEVVRTHMMHGPCGDLYRSSACMSRDGCVKGYPKEYSS
ncbi:hypothetical protein Tco_0743416 [Tanacetum coccineum]